jgi:hypothetical protein
MELTIVTLAFSILFSIVFLILGGIVGWIANETISDDNEFQDHPELYDENGMIIPNDLLTVRFEPTEDFFYDNYED